VRRTVATLAGMLSLVTVGCLSYTPIDGNEPAPRLGMEVRAHLSTPESFPLTNLTANNVVEVDGEIVRWEEDRLVLSAWWLRAGSGIEHRGIGETVNIPRSSLGAVERKQLSVTRTGVLVGFIALLGVLAQAALSAGAGPEGSQNGPGPER
jgi:hypothetical protein